MAQESVMEFPCEFPIKVMGRDTPEFRETMRTIIESHAGEVDDSRVQAAVSRNGRFVSVTVTITADSQEQLMNVTQFSLAVGLSGKQVTGYDASGNQVTGQVDNIRFASTGAELQIGQTWLPLSNVVEVAPES